MTQRSYSMADAYRSIYEKKEDTKDWPSIKDAKEPKKTNVKYDKHMGLHAPTIKEAIDILEEEGLLNEIDMKKFKDELRAKGAVFVDDPKPVAQPKAKKPAPKKDNRTPSERMADAYASPRRGPLGAVRAD